MNKFKAGYFVFMSTIFITFVFLMSSHLDSIKAKDIEISNNINAVSYDSDDRILAIGNKIAYILEADLLNVGDSINYESFDDDKIINYLENALFYQVNDVDFFDLDYVDVCSDDYILGCVDVENNNNNVYGISTTSLKNYAYLLFDRKIEVDSDFTYNDEGFVFPTKIVNKDIRLLFDRYSINNDDRYYLIEYTGYLDNNRVTYIVMLDIIGKNDISKSTFDDVSFKYIKRIK